MPARLRPYLTYANVMATVAVFFALAGTSYAAIVITGKNVKDGTLTGKDIRDRSITAKDVTGVVGPRGEQGPQGAPGPQGPQGPQGHNATRLWAVVNADGSLARGSGVTSISGGPSAGVSNYRIDFGRDITGCARIASLGTAGQTSSPEGGSAFTSIGFYPSEVSVHTYGGAGGGQYRSFHLAVFC